VKTDGTVVKTFSPEKLGSIPASKETIKFLNSALREVVVSGTGAGVFGGFPLAISGKTGTAQVFGKNPNEKDKPKVAPLPGAANPPAKPQGTPPKTPTQDQSKPTASPAQSKPTTPLIESPSFSPVPLALVTPAGEDVQGTQEKSDQLDPKEVDQAIQEQKSKEKGTDTAKSLTPAQTTSPTSSSPNLGPPAKPSPNVIVAQAPSTKSVPMPPAPPPSSQAAADVPMISSSNPDNFYTLYSQINYNVVL
jgi:hypothetical protein